MEFKLLLHPIFVPDKITLCAVKSLISRLSDRIREQTVCGKGEKFNFAACSYFIFKRFQIHFLLKEKK